MTRLSTFKGQGRATLVIHVVALLLMMLLSACGDGSSSSDMGLDGSSPEPTENGSAVFTIQWHNAPTVKGLVTTLAEEPMNCENAGVEWITCRVYDESNNHLITGDRWPCSEHSGRIDGIPVGHSRKFAILGEDADGNIVYQGQKQDILIDARPDNDAGTIEAHPFVPLGLTATTVSASQIDLSWKAPNTNASFAGYRIYRDGVEMGTSASLSHNDTGLTQNTKYCYTVSAHDAFGNESGPSNQDCATTETSDDEDPPTIPTGLEAQAMSSSQIDLSWTASTDNVSVTGYWIYRDGDRVGKSVSPPYSDTGLTQNTRYCYTVEAYDAAGNESGLSGEDCEPTMESFDWYRDKDKDKYGDPNDSINSETQPEGYVSDNADCNDNDPSIHPGATEACNGIDDDCDGNTDEGIDPVPTTCGIGQCASSGERACIGGQLVDSCQSGTPEKEVCDGLDNDCDGNADEGIDPVPITCGTGECASSGERACIDGQLVNSCQPGTPEDEVCDGLDNDCDGDVDNGLSFNYYYWDDDEDNYGDPDNWTWDCEMPPGYVADNTDCNDFDYYINPGADEILGDNVDNDCDGEVDENGYVVYENGQSLWDGAISINYQAVADDFSLNNSSTLYGASVDLWVYTDTFIFDGLKWWIFNNNNGLPGSIIAQGSGESYLPTYIGPHSSGNTNLWKLYFDLGENIYIEANEIYWFCIKLLDQTSSIVWSDTWATGFNDASSQNATFDNWDQLSSSFRNPAFSLYGIR